MIVSRLRLASLFKAAFSAGFLALAAPALAQESCRQALALGLDVSGSVDATEYRLQLDGLAGALTDPDVAAAIVQPGAAPIALYVFEWSGPAYQVTLHDWQRIETQADLTNLAQTLRDTSRRPAPPSTALGTAIATGARALARGPECWKATLDISGDGKSNTGPRPQDVGDLPALSDVTINALVILTDDRFGTSGATDDLLSYFETLVIRGPDAFAEVADGFEDYTEAMKRKLLREIEALAIGALPAQ